MIELNKMTTIKAKLDAIMNKMNNQEKRGHSCNEVGIVEGSEQKSVANIGLAHEGAYQVDEVQYINGSKSYNFKPNNNLPTHCTPALTCRISLGILSLVIQKRIPRTTWPLH